MSRPAVFFDRDNTLIVNDGYLGDPNGVVLFSDAAAAVAAACELGFAVVVVSNQSGVARGLFSEADVRAVNERMSHLLLQANPKALIDRHEFCPFHPQAVVERYRIDSDLRKPKPGMILHAARAIDLDLSRSWVIGDTPRDIQAGQAAGCKTILVQSPDVAASPAAADESAVTPDATAKSLTEAMQIIAAPRD